MTEIESVWRFPPHIETNRTHRCHPADGVLDVMFEDGRVVEAPIAVSDELMRVFRVGDLAELANLPVEVRSEPAGGFVQLDENVHIGRKSPPEGA